MNLFGYGSLMNEKSLKKTIPDAKIIGKTHLSGYRRVFNKKSPYRKNPETGIHSSVLNMEKDSISSLYGLLIELPTDINEELKRREAEYDFVEVMLDDGTKAMTYISDVANPYPYIFNDDIQKEYLNICVEAAKANDFLDDFLSTTYIGEKTVAELGLY